MVIAKKTWMPKESDIAPQWFLIDAKGKILGRLAVQISKILQGKHTPRYTPHMDMGDYCVVVNAEAVAVTADKDKTKTYFRHSGYPGGDKITPLEKVRENHPERIIESAVRGMLPKGRLGQSMIKKLKVYSGPNHPHENHKLQEVSRG